MEMANLCGQSISEFLRNQFMVGLCGIWWTSTPDHSLSNIEELQVKNCDRFGIWVWVWVGA